MHLKLKYFWRLQFKILQMYVWILSMSLIHISDSGLLIAVALVAVVKIVSETAMLMR